MFFSFFVQWYSPFFSVITFAIFHQECALFPSGLTRVLRRECSILGLSRLYKLLFVDAAFRSPRQHVPPALLRHKSGLSPPNVLCHRHSFSTLLLGSSRFWTFLWVASYWGFASACLAPLVITCPSFELAFQPVWAFPAQSHVFSLVWFRLPLFCHLVIFQRVCSTRSKHPHRPVLLTPPACR